MKKKIIFRNYFHDDKMDVIDLWNRCGLIIQSNDPEKDIELKMKFQPELFFVATLDNRVIGSVMTGYDGHRGWLNYLCIHPDYRNSGYGRSLVEFAVQQLKKFNCPKVNLQVRNTNTKVIDFYKKLGFYEHEVIGMQLKL